jgi:hypothetical protein
MFQSDVKRGIKRGPVDAGLSPRDDFAQAEHA